MAAVGARVRAAEVISSPRGCLETSGRFSRPPKSTPGAAAHGGASRAAWSTPSSRQTMGGDGAKKTGTFDEMEGFARSIP